MYSTAVLYLRYGTVGGSVMCEAYRRAGVGVEVQVDATCAGRRDLTR